MANFKTHLTVASTVSGIVAISCLETGLATPKEVPMYFAAGLIGGMLPDIDADYSVPIQILFRFLAVVLAFLTVFSRAGTYAIVELALVWLVVYFFMRSVVCNLFAMFTVHRGIFHSLLAAVFFCVLATALSYHVFALSPLHAWLTGGFVTLGYVTHLVLDELYSVDLTGARLKRSFGTALKLTSTKSIAASVVLGLATVLLFWFATPKTDTLVQTLGDWRIYSSIRQKFWPQDGWFRMQR